MQSQKHPSLKILKIGRVHMNKKKAIMKEAFKNWKGISISSP
jgi:hypothetical protein